MIEILALAAEICPAARAKIRTNFVPTWYGFSYRVNTRYGFSNIVCTWYGFSCLVRTRHGFSYRNSYQIWILVMGTYFVPDSYPVINRYENLTGYVLGTKIGTRYEIGTKTVPVPYSVQKSVPGTTVGQMDCRTNGL